jgi:hypothetical protein
MGVKKNISATQFPKQGGMLGKHIEVFFDYDTTKIFSAVCIRYDMEYPGEQIFRLDDGRVIRSVECQWWPDKPGD